MASKFLEAPAVAVDLSWTLDHRLRRQLHFEARRGIGENKAVLSFSEGSCGHRLEAGMERFRVRITGQPIRVVRVVAPRSISQMDSHYEFWAVPEVHLRRFYRFLRRLSASEQRHEPPIMRDADQERLWEHTIGFLRRGCEILRRFGVAQKRGVLLLGEPGNGKTMACRWLRSECGRHGLQWRSVTAEEYESKRGDAEAHELFELDRPGIICFDDMDIALRDRERFGETRDHSTFLGSLDGLEMRQGIVFIFTSNARPSDLDPAFCRPGRIDLILNFARPDAQQRRRLMLESWHSEIVGRLPVEDAVRQTEGLSFAEIEEVKRLLVLDHLKSARWDWPAALEAFQTGQRHRASKGAIGFASPRSQTSSRSVSVTR